MAAKSVGTAVNTVDAQFWVGFLDEKIKMDFDIAFAPYKKTKKHFLSVFFTSNFNGFETNSPPLPFSPPRQPE